MTASLDIPAADAYCQFLAGRHYENFAVASRFLPREARIHLARIYAFARTTDDLGDESAEDAPARLGRWRTDVEECFSGEITPIHPVLVAVRESARSLGLSSQPFLDLVDANIQDQQITRYEDWEPLRQYCMLSAAPVGRLVLRVFGIQDPRADALSDDVCIGLQLANFAQDVSIDRAKGRAYVLQTDIRSGGIRAAVRSLCDRAEDLLRSGEELEAMVSGRLRLQLSLYRLGGLAIIGEVRKIEYRTDERRPEVSGRTKAGLVLRAGFGRGRRMGHVPAPGSA